MSQLKQLYYTLSSVLPVTQLLKAAGNPVLFPYHHLVSNHNALHIRHLYSYKNEQQFADDLDYMLRYLRPVSANELSAAVKSKQPLPSNAFLMSFDDGLREVYDVIAPVLLKKGIPAVFFINPAFVDNKELFYRCKLSLIIEELSNTDVSIQLLEQCRNLLNLPSHTSLNEVKHAVKQINNLTAHLADELGLLLGISFNDFLETQQPFLTTEQITELGKKGFTIGAHSWNHPYYHLLTDEEKLEQTISSMNYVTTHFKPSVTTFSFPHFDNRLSQTFFDALKERTSIDLLFGIQNQKYELQNKMLHRFNAERPELPFKKQLHGVLLFMILQRFTGMHAVKRKV